MLYNKCTGIYKFGNNTYPWHIRHRSNLGHIFQGKKCVLWAGKYGTYVYKICASQAIPCTLRCYPYGILECANRQHVPL